MARKPEHTSFDTEIGVTLALFRCRLTQNAIFRVDGRTYALCKGTLIYSFVCFNLTCKINFALYMGNCAVTSLMASNKTWLRSNCNKFSNRACPDL